ncbi:hypothetical protein E2320_002173, partial [Naja naja]
MSNLSAAEIQGTTNIPAAKPNATVHFEELTPDEFLDYLEDDRSVIKSKSTEDTGIEEERPETVTQEHIIPRRSERSNNGYTSRTLHC